MYNDYSSRENELVEELIKEACETVALEQQEEEMMAALGAWTRQCAMTPMEPIRTIQLLDLVKIIGASSQLVGNSGCGGLKNPALVLTEYANAGKLDGMPTEELHEVREGVAELARLWEGEEAQQGLPLACNAILQTVMKDEKLFAQVFETTYRRIAKAVRKTSNNYARQCARRHGNW